MEYQDVIRDFALRTKKNLEYIETKASEDNSNPEVYEVTQLINSLLGLIVFPREEYMSRLPQTPLSDLVDQGWAVPRIVGDYPQVKTLRELIDYIRHAISHFNIEFIPNSERKITGIILWNREYRGGKPGEIIWKAELNIEELRKLAFKFIDLILESR
jgi:hypothetical protein